MTERTDSKRKKSPEPYLSYLEELSDPNLLPSRDDVVETWVRLINSDQEGYGAWAHFIHNDENPTFEILTKEYIEALGNYLAERIKTLAKTKRPVVILEVGAGNGRLTHFLKKILNRLVPGLFEITAVDSGRYNITQFFQVEKIKNRPALEQYQPAIVISSWMEYQTDWTADFRATESVQEYILIGGEWVEGIIGHPWLTFGYGRKGAEAPYKADGFEQQKLKKVSAVQLNRLDAPEYAIKHSETVSFKRVRQVQDIQPNLEPLQPGTPEHERLTWWMYDPTYLPTRSEVLKTWRRFESSGKLGKKEWEDFIRKDEGKLSEIWTQEYIHALADYLSARIRRLSQEGKNKVVILEVDAGDGRLTHFLRERLNQQIQGWFEIVATDSGDEEIEPVFEVKRLNHEEAIETYKPTIVINSWMPVDEDWTPEFRQSLNIQEYILIVSSHPDMAGGPWYTGSREPAEDYKEEGFSMQELFALSQHQISPIEDNPFEDENTSRTVTFRKDGGVTRRRPKDV